MPDKNKLLPGGYSLLTVGLVLCLTVFALLALTTAQSYDSLSVAAADSVRQYYIADSEAELIFAELRLCHENNAPLPDGVKQTGNRYTYTCQISDIRQLEVELAFDDEGWHILRWQSVAVVEYSETLPIRSTEPIT